MFAKNMDLIALLFPFLIATNYSVSGEGSSEFVKLRASHRAGRLSTAELGLVAGLSNVTQIDEILDNILIPRVVGTSNHEKVFKYLSREMRKLGWQVDMDEFVDRTPLFGDLKFRNVIATLNPNAERFLVLACHYDSKYFEDQVFVGATDSAVPCAMLVNLATILRRHLEHDRNSELSLKFMFFDGEEAFVQWGPKDSIYGARHLVDKYHRTRLQSAITGESVSDLDRIDVLMLLDLLGAPNPSFYSYFKNTDGWHLKMAEIEDRLAEIGALKPYQSRYFKRRTSPSYIEDDHIPFLKKGVPILHLITQPFPSVWHTPGDDRNIIDMNTVENLNKIFATFVVEYLKFNSDQNLSLDLPSTADYSLLGYTVVRPYIWNSFRYLFS